MFTPETHPTDFDADAADVVVGQQSAAFGQHGEVLGTSGLGTCVGIALYNPVTLEGFLGHFYPDNAVEAIERVPRRLISEAAQAWVAGAGYALPNVPAEYTRSTRVNVIDSLSKIGIIDAHITAVWLDSLEYIGSMQLNTLNGECRIGISEELSLIPSDDYL